MSHGKVRLPNLHGIGGTPKDGTLVTQWRTTPAIHDWDKDGTNDLIMLDHEGYLAFFQGARRANYNVLRAPQRIFKGAGEYDSRHRSCV